MAHNESFSCHPSDDRDIIEYLNEPGRNKSATIKKAIRFYKRYRQDMTPEALTEKLAKLADLLEAVEAIKAMLESGQAPVRPDGAKVKTDIMVDVMNQMDEM